MKTADWIESIEKKLELSHDTAQAALDKLHKHGFVNISVLKNLKKEGWERLDLPANIEEEMKTQIATLRASYAHSWYGMGMPYFMSFPGQQGYWSQYNQMGQPIFMPYPPYESQDAVLGMGDVSDKEKEKASDEKEPEPMETDSQTAASQEPTQIAPNTEIEKPTEVKEEKMEGATEQ
eukprot:TRINITY_DN4165_c0_g1_i1.p1 TRINITY_DN4165_c0_g1~~TRINITY_DN4165_c0_g1_i1.p1  ORF type:complete len:178 (+),score=59.53 TRINITY_DN4165_c0_g1_i1:64-597(+)